VAEALRMLSKVCQSVVDLRDQQLLAVVQSSHRCFHLCYLSLFFTHQTVP
jgi:hypothetical protein